MIMKLGVSPFGEVQAVDVFYPSCEVLITCVGREIGWSPMNKDQFGYLRGKGSRVVGDVQKAVDKIIAQYELFHNARFVAQLVTGFTPHKDILKAIELYGTKVAPVVS